MGVVFESSRGVLELAEAVLRVSWVGLERSCVGLFQGPLGASRGTSELEASERQELEGGKFLVGRGAPSWGGGSPQPPGPS